MAPKYADSQRLPECWREILRLPLKPIQERENRTSGFEPVTSVSTPLPLLPTSEPGTKVIVTCSNTNLPAFTVRIINNKIFICSKTLYFSRPVFKS